MDITEEQRELRIWHDTFKFDDDHDKNICVYCNPSSLFVKQQARNRTHKKIKAMRWIFDQMDEKKLSKDSVIADIDDILG